MKEGEIRMENVMGVINLVNEKEGLKELTLHRHLSAVPFGGRYRLIDFPLSNMVNSGINDVAVFTKGKYRALIDHLGKGKDWDLDRNRGGLYLLPPFNQSSDQLKGDLQYFYEHFDYFYRGKQDYVLLSNGHLIFNMDYRSAFEFHQKVGADITILYKEIENEIDEFKNCRRIQVNEQNRLLSFEPSNKVFMEVIILEKSLLLDLIKSNIEKGLYHLIIDGIGRNLSQLQVYGYPYQGYLANIDSIQTYHQRNMDLLNPQLWKSLFFEPHQISTKVKNEPPTKYLRESNVTNTIVANGCVIEGTIENSILFRGVKVHKGAQIKNSIILQKCEIGENARLENVILDKEVRVTMGQHLKGNVESPIVVGKRMTV